MNVQSTILGSRDKTSLGRGLFPETGGLEHRLGIHRLLNKKCTDGRYPQHLRQTAVIFVFVI